MFFEDYGVRGFVTAEKDNFSTFAVDVDTGAYTVARRYVQDGFLPPPDSIRPEEFINYFHYAYPNPSQEETFGIHRGRRADTVHGGQLKNLLVALGDAPDCLLARGLGLGEVCEGLPLQFAQKAIG